MVLRGSGDSLLAIFCLQISKCVDNIYEKQNGGDSVDVENDFYRLPFEDIVCKLREVKEKYDSQGSNSDVIVLVHQLSCIADKSYEKGKDSWANTWVQNVLSVRARDIEEGIEKDEGRGPPTPGLTLEVPLVMAMGAPAHPLARTCV